MAVLRTIKSDYVIYENVCTGSFVAIARENVKSIQSFYKKFKGKKCMRDEKIPGYKMVLDLEFDSLKIDFGIAYQFKIKDLIKVK